MRSERWSQSGEGVSKPGPAASYRYATRAVPLTGPGADAPRPPLPGGERNQRGRHWRPSSSAG